MRREFPTIEQLVADSAPVWADWTLALAMIAAGLAMGYIGMRRVNDAAGLYVVASRLVGVLWLFLGGRAVFFLLRYGDLLQTWWNAVPLFGLAACTVVMAHQRLHAGRLEYDGKSQAHALAVRAWRRVARLWGYPP